MQHDHVDIRCNILDLEKHFERGSVDEIYACHVLEHVSRHSIDAFFKVCSRVMRIGGVLRIAVPDMEQIFKLYNDGTPLFPKLYGLIWGGQRDEYDYHTCGFDLATLGKFAARSGFGDCQRYRWQDFLPDAYDDYSRCFIPHMDFENGALVSLNVTCVKKPPMLIYCTGGFANAVNSLIAGVRYARSQGMELYVHWVEGYIALDVKLQDIFDVRDATINFLNEREFIEMLRGAENALLVTHNRQLAHIQGVKGTLVHTAEISGLPTDLSGRDLVFFHIDALPPYVVSDAKQYYASFFEAFAFKSELQRAASDFLEAIHATLGKKVTCGVHIRGTDILAFSGRTHDHVCVFMKNLAERHANQLPMLVCTDDAEVRRRLESMGNGMFVFYDHKHYVERRDGSIPWSHDEGTDHINCRTFEHQGKQYKHYSWTNVYRPTGQVLAGVIDIMLLSSMEHLYAYETSSNSTYFKFAHLLQTYKSSISK